MSVVTVSPKYQVVIPKEIRTALKIKPGQKLDMIAGDLSIRLMPQRSIKEMEGIFKDYPAPPFVREKKDREF